MERNFNLDIAKVLLAIGTGCSEDEVQALRKHCLLSEEENQIIDLLVRLSTGKPISRSIVERLVDSNVDSNRVIAKHILRKIDDA